MKIWITSLFAVTLICGCSTTPSSPKPHPEKYTFQVVGIEIPDMTLQSLTIDVEKIIQHPDAEISEYPIVLVALGESVTNDQSKAVSFPEDYDLVDGKAVVVKEKICKLGYSTSVTVDKIENGAISYHLNATHQELAGFDEYKTEGGVVKMPFFKKRAVVDTGLTQQPNSWFSIGGLVDERSDAKKNLMICVRIIPPITNK